MSHCCDGQGASRLGGPHVNNSIFSCGSTFFICTVFAVADGMALHGTDV